MIYADLELLVVNKPAGLVCHPTKAGEYSSLIGRLRLYLEVGNTQTPPVILPGSRAEDHVLTSVFLSGRSLAKVDHISRPVARLVNRLDRETSGVVIAALTRQAAGGLGRLWETRAVQKEHLALVH